MPALLVSLHAFLDFSVPDTPSFLPNLEEGVSVLKGVSKDFSFFYMYQSADLSCDSLGRLLEQDDFPPGELLSVQDAVSKADSAFFACIGILEDMKLFSRFRCPSLLIHPSVLSWADVSQRLRSFVQDEAAIRPVARIHTGFSEKFGIPRQSGLVKDLTGVIVFEPEFRRTEAVKELEGFSHLWLIWQFSKAVPGGWRPTVRPPRLGGNRRVGVFASRSPYRPNHLGLSCVKLEGVDRKAKDGPILLVSGIDMLDGTPIFDIKPYIPVADRPENPLEGYTRQTRTHLLQVHFPEDLAQKLPQDTLSAIKGVLASDPRPGYEDSPEEVYGLAFDGFDIGFRVSEGVAAVLRVDRI